MCDISSLYLISYLTHASPALFYREASQTSPRGAVVTRSVCLSGGLRKNTAVVISIRPSTVFRFQMRGVRRSSGGHLCIWFVTSGGGRWYDMVVWYGGMVGGGMAVTAVVVVGGGGEKAVCPALGRDHVTDHVTATLDVPDATSRYSWGDERRAGRPTDTTG